MIGKTFVQTLSLMEKWCWQEQKQAIENHSPKVALLQDAVSAKQA